MQKAAFPTSTTRRTNNDRAGARAYTLAEVMLATCIGSFILGGVMTTYLMIGRVIENTGNYCDLDSNARQGLETFSREARNACYVGQSFTATSVVFAVPYTASSTVPIVPVANVEPSPLVNTSTYYIVTYQLAADNQYPTQNALVRIGPPLADTSVYNAGSVNTTTYLIHNVKSLTFNYYSLYGSGYYNGDLTLPANVVVVGAAGAPKSIKQVELTLTAQRASSTVVNATNTVISARFGLRNKL
jgi:hypothetical protein